VQSHVALLKQERRKLKNNLGVESGSGDRSRIVLPGAYTAESEGLAYFPVSLTQTAAVVVDDKPKRKGSVASTAVAAAPSDTPLSLRYALDCLVNARALLTAGNAARSAPVPPFASGDGSGETEGCCIRGPARSSTSDANALICCLLDLAYLSLASEDAPTALEAASSALSLNPPLADYMHLARVYAAEAQAMLGRFEESLILLRPPAPSEAEEVPQLAKGAGGMRVVLYTDFVSVLIFRGECERAQAVLQAALQLSPNPSPDLFLLQAYLILRTKRDPRSILALLKRGRPLPRAKRAK
jgi:tetratricopeptide (TPR) repeat protein